MIYAGNLPWPSVPLSRLFREHVLSIATSTETIPTYFLEHDRIIQLLDSFRAIGVSSQDKIVACLHSLMDIDFIDFRTAYNTTFGSDYRRRTMQASFLISESYVSSANAPLQQGKSINITTGLLYAVDDACQLIASTPALRTGHIPGETTDVIRILDNGQFDGVRFKDYHFLNEMSKDGAEYGRGKYHALLSQVFQQFQSPQGLAGMTESYLGLRHKMLSLSPFRRILGDLFSDMSVFWVMSHEDAHEYGGHIEVFRRHQAESRMDASEIGAFPLIFSELSRLHLPSNNVPSGLRVSSEVLADTDANRRIVDHAFDMDIFLVYPDLKAIRLEFINSYLDDLNVEQCNTLLIGRWIATAVFTTLAMFGRCLVLNNVVSSDYPTMKVRLLNSLLDLAHFVEMNAARQSGFEPLRENFHILLNGMSYDLCVVLDQMFIDRRVLTWPKESQQSYTLSTLIGFDSWRELGSAMEALSLGLKLIKSSENITVEPISTGETTYDFLLKLSSAVKEAGLPSAVAEWIENRIQASDDLIDHFAPASVMVFPERREVVAEGVDSSRSHADLLRAYRLFLESREETA